MEQLLLVQQRALQHKLEKHTCIKLSFVPVNPIFPKTQWTLNITLTDAFLTWAKQKGDGINLKRASAYPGEHGYSEHPGACIVKQWHDVAITSFWSRERIWVRFDEFDQSNTCSVTSLHRLELSTVQNFGKCFQNLPQEFQRTYARPVYFQY